MIKKFLRQDIARHSKLGKNRPKLEKWRKPKGRHSKMRLYRKSYPASPSIGYGSSKEELGNVKGKKPVLVSNKSDLENITKNNIIILSTRLGARKKMEILKMITEKNLEVYNLKKETKK